jgi:4-carboxymuconolactone decarboxylase
LQQTKRGGYYTDHRVSDATYERVVKRFGEKGAVDLAGLIGYYSFVSVTLNVFEVPTPPGAKLLGK